MCARAVFVLLLISVFSCVSLLLAQVSPDTESYTDSEAYAVYSALLDSALSTNKRLGTPVIRIETEAFANCLNSVDRQPEVGEAVARYIAQAPKNWLLQREFNISRPYEMMHKDEIKTMFTAPGDGWERFYARFPGSPGIFEFSAVGFNADRTVAVLYMGNHCHWLCGGGTQHVLQKKDGKWQTMKGIGGVCGWAS